MTHRERMLAAYRKEVPDRVAVSPELWYDFSVPLDLDCTWQDICLGRYPLWKAQRAAHRYFGTAAWLIAAPLGGEVNGQIVSDHSFTAGGDLEFHYCGTCSRGKLEWRIRHNEKFSDWMVEHPIKHVPDDLPAFEELFFSDPETMDYREIQRALEGVGQEGVITAYAGPLFFNFIASHIEGGAGDAILAMLDREGLFLDLQKKFISRIVKIAEKIMRDTNAQVLLMDNGYSTAGIISPSMYKQWDVPVIQAVADAVHRQGRLLHLHQHGKCMDLLDLIASAGADLVEPFERPPGGDTPDLGVVKAKYGKHFAIRGNLHAHQTLLRGTPADVEREVRQCLEAAAPGGGFILASGDGVIAGTPYENIFAMAAAGEKYGGYYP